MHAMLLSSLLQHRSRGPVGRFLQDRRGGVAPMFALAIIPVIGLVGAAVDYSRANSVKAGMQSALDSTALAMSKLAPTLTQAQLQAQTTAYFQAMFTYPEAKNLVVTPVYSTSSGTSLKITSSATIDTAFMRIMGHSSLDIGSSSTVKWGMNRLRVALALDNTGSMTSAGKIGALKTATKSLLTQLKAAATTNGDVYVSIIPFNRDVNAKDLGSSSSSWIRWTKTGTDTDSWDDNNGSCSGSGWYWGWGGGWGWGGTSGSKSSCTGTWAPDNHNTWNGCIMDRDQSYDVTNTAPSAATPATLFPAQQYDSCPIPMMGLSYDWTALNSKVDAMTAEGNTNQGIGLAWAWQSLTAAPFTIPAKDPNYVYTDIIILMSDGLNTQNRWTTNESTIDARQATMCTNVKAAGIVLYTIHVNTDGDPTSTVLKNCASTTDKFYTVTSSGQISTVFTQIGTNLSKLRISN
jgi:Flp pilus assembly protein TadG